MVAMSDDWLSKPSGDAPEDPPTQAAPSSDPYGQYGQSTGQPGQPGQAGQSGYGQPDPYAKPDPYGQQPYTAPQPYQQPPSGYPQHSGGYPPYGYNAPPPSHPSANTALVLGLIALVGGFSCAIPLVCGPFAWSIGRKAMREIDANPTLYSGRGSAQAGMILGIIATVLLVLSVLAIVGFIALFAIAGTTSST